MNILILGDIHGARNIASLMMQYAHTAQNITQVLHVGDMATGYGLPHWDKPVEDITFHYVDGNHDNYLKCTETNPYYGWCNHIARGSHIQAEQTNVLGIGGAHSIDKAFQERQHTWWETEEPTYGQWMQIHSDVAESSTQPTHIVLTHEYPLSFGFNASLRHKDTKASDRVRIGLDTVLDILDPKPLWWFFGHHHIAHLGEYNGTNWACCPDVRSGIYGILDVHTMDFQWHKLPEAIYTDPSPRQVTERCLF